MNAFLKYLSSAFCRMRMLLLEFRYRRAKVLQHDMSDCGAAAIASVLAFYGSRVAIGELRRMMGTGKNGTDLNSMRKCLLSMNFESEGIRAGHVGGLPDISILEELPMPMILHVKNEKGYAHYICLYAVCKTFYMVMDPADGYFRRLTASGLSAAWTGTALVAMPSVNYAAMDRSMNVVSRLAALVRPNMGLMMQIIVGAIVYTVLGLSQSIYIQKIVDHVLPGGNRNLMNLLGLGMFLILAASLVINYWKSRFTVRIGTYMDLSLILGYYNHVIRLPRQFFDRMRSGEILSRISDASKIRGFINESLMSLFVNVLIIIVSVIFMFTIYWKLALILLASLPVYSILFYFYNRISSIVQREIMENAADMQSHLVETVSSVTTVKQFGLEDRFCRKAEGKYVGMLRKSYESFMNSLNTSIISEFLSKGLTIGLLWAGACYVMDSRLTPGELMSFYSLISYFISPVASIIGLGRHYQDARIASERLFEILDIEKEDSSGKMMLERTQFGDITFENVAFSYDGRASLFEGLDLVIKSGSITGIAGQSGCGKSSLIGLIQNLYAPLSGRIAISGIDVRHISFECLRKNISVVPQNIELFDASIIDNIVLDDTEPDVARLMDVVRKLGLYEFISSLPFGFATMAGERGVCLSGGQKQKIAIARAIYKNPKIIILDEATSALDYESEISVRNLLSEYRDGGGTVIMVAHRLNNLVNADNIIVMDGGKICERGRHEELIASGGLYCRLWNMQTC